MRRNLKTEKFNQNVGAIYTIVKSRQELTALFAPIIGLIIGLVCHINLLTILSIVGMVSSLIDFIIGAILGGIVSGTNLCDGYDLPTWFVFCQYLFFRGN